MECENKWLFFINRAHLFIYKRSAREAWKPRTSKSRFQKRWDKHQRRLTRVLEKFSEESLYKPSPMIGWINDLRSKA